MPRWLSHLLLAAGLAACAAADRPMQLLEGAGPVYPNEARLDGIEGEVVVRYDVTVEGRVSNARVVSAVPEGVFEQAALEAIRQWRYRPPYRDGEAQAVTGVESTVRFRFDDGRYDGY